MKSITDILTSRKTTDEMKERLFTQVKSAKDKAEGNRTKYIERFNESYKYYNCKLPGATYINRGSYKDKSPYNEYVEPVLKNAVKAGLTQLLGTFTEDDSLAFAFRQRGFRHNPAIEELVTYNINKIFLREQDGYHILENLFRETLITGDSFAKVYVDEQKHHDTMIIQDWIEVSDFMSELAEGWKINTPKVFDKKKDGKFKGFEWKEEKTVVVDPQSGQPQETEILLIKGKIPLIKQENKIKIEQIDSSDIWVPEEVSETLSAIR